MTMKQDRVEEIQAEARKQTIANLIEWIGSEDALNSVEPNLSYDNEDQRQAQQDGYEEVMGKVLALLQSMQK